MNKILPTLMLLLLVGCGSESETNPESPVSPVDIMALNGLFTAIVDTEKKLDLTPYVMGNKSHIKISNISSSYPDRCFSTITDNLNFDVLMSKPGRCDYTYTVLNELEQEDTAEIIVVSSTTDNPVLPNISVAVAMGSPDVVIDLKKELGAVIEGYLLEPELIIQVSQGSIGGNATVEATQSIKYIIPNQFGWNYIAYTLTNAIGDTRIGYVFVSIADEINEPPVISDPKHVHLLTATAGVPMTIDFDNVRENNFTKLKDKAHNSDNIFVLHNTTPELCAKTCLLTDNCTSFDFVVSSNACSGKNTFRWLLPRVGLDAYFIPSDTHPLIITDDSDVWGVSNALSIGASVEPVTTNLNNKKITFTAANPGKYYVNYIVSDHKGGSTLGQIQVHVERAFLH